MRVVAAEMRCVLGMRRHVGAIVRAPMGHEAQARDNDALVGGWDALTR